MICTTLNKIRSHSPCASGWKKLLANLGKTQADDEPLALQTILDSNGLQDALWCARTLPEREKEWRLYAVWCARRVQHLMHDPRSLAALDAAEGFADGEITAYDLNLACEAASAAARASSAASAASASCAASSAASSAASAAAWAAAWAARAASVSCAAAYESAYEAASAAASAAAYESAYEAASAAASAQEAEFRRVVG